MKWAELRRVLRGKLKAVERPGKKHDLWFVFSRAPSGLARAVLSAKAPGVRLRAGPPSTRHP